MKVRGKWMKMDMTEERDNDDVWSNVSENEDWS